MNNKSGEDLLKENELLRSRLSEANDTLEAIRTGQIDALVVNDQNGHSLYTLRSADRAYRVFIEQMAEGAVSLNSDGLIIYCNSQFAELINRPLSSVVGHKFSEFVASREKTYFDLLLNQAWKKNIKSEIALISENKLVHVKVSIKVLELENEIVLSMIVTDLTQQKDSERQLKAKNDELRNLNEDLINSNHDLQQFASVASHDLQEPLRKIQVFSKFLKDNIDSELSDLSQQYVEKIITCSQRMKALIIDILTYSKLSAADKNLEEIDLSELFDEILEDFDLKIIENNATIQLDKLCVVEGNKGQLRQVFHNLVSNALKFVSPERKPIMSIKSFKFNSNDLGLSLENESDYCRVSVKDNGIGFDDRFSSSIFGLFEKLNPSTTFEGSGIGLAIAKKIIDKHHGFIIANSTIGKGSEFNVILPFKQPRSK